MGIFGRNPFPRGLLTKFDLYCGLRKAQFQSFGLQWYLVPFTFVVFLVPLTMIVIDMVNKEPIGWSSDFFFFFRQLQNLNIKKIWQVFVMHMSIPTASCPSPPPGSPPGICLFFLMDGKFLGAGALKLSNARRWGRKERQMPPALYLLGNFRSEYEHDYAYKFSFLSAGTLKNVDLET